jgi:hypothetical protein
MVARFCAPLEGFWNDHVRQHREDRPGRVMKGVVRVPEIAAQHGIGVALSSCNRFRGESSRSRRGRASRIACNCRKWDAATDLAVANRTA